ncbi:hypothetical protein Clacol_004246 [Clathrus columnatus]|uniref:Uncharacterized protein n=1 Tax=Clathrus columnatus TaxID=1419009 RepID=A0AAV5A6W2_9AGAM|nr:hypothetical protein Clacol_004246 [Clathrus columnatus]
MDHTAFKQLIFWRPTTELFSSRLTSIHWWGDQMHFENLLAILTPILQHLNVTLGFIELPELEALFKMIATRSPSLLMFQFLITTLRSAVVSHSLDELMSCLSQLTTLALPTYFLTPELFTILSRLPCLQHLTLFSRENCRQVLRMEIDTSMTVTEKNKLELGDPRPFHSLQNLYISDERSCKITKIFTPGIRFSELVCLDYALNSPNMDELVNFMELIHVTFLSLREIILRKPHQLSTSRFLPWEAVQPLLKCPHIHTLKVIGCGIDMKPRDIVTVATNRTFWRAVTLFSSNPFDFHTLIVFVQNYPELVELGLELSDALGLPDLSNFETDVWFSSLKTLYI